VSFRAHPVLIGVLSVAPAAAQGQAVVSGTVRERAASRPLARVEVLIEEGPRTLTDSLGHYQLTDVAPGVRVLVARRIGYAPVRVRIVVPPGGAVTRDLVLSTSALTLPGITVTAEPATRARGELTSASVIEREAIANQVAASLLGVLELTPGVVLSAPGLDNVQQIALRAVPVSGGDGGANPSAGDLGSQGTLIVLDGVPLSNNANLQSAGPRGELQPPTSAGGGIDLRRLPATTIERVEVIRGLPSARYGDLTQGAIVVDTRAGAVDPEAQVRFDARTLETSLVGGRAFGGHALSATFDAARTRISPGLSDAQSTRLAAQLAHRVTAGRVILDSRLDAFRLVADNPEQPEVLPGYVTSTREEGLRAALRGRLQFDRGWTLHLAAGGDLQRQRSHLQAFRLRPVLPFTDALTEGRTVGRYIGARYLSQYDLEGDPRLVFTRLELTGGAKRFLGGEHQPLVGIELRREWNRGAGYRFDMEFPPQSDFNGVRGFDRPRRFDAVPPLVGSAFYADDRIAHALGSWTIALQGGVRLDLLHRGSGWLSGARATAWQPRLTAEISPAWWLRVRGSAGRTAKIPGAGSLAPAPQYFDVVNVNWFPNDPAERLAILTTVIRDPTNPDLTFARGLKREVAVEFALGRPDAALEVVVFADRVDGAFGTVQLPGFLLRDRYQLTDSTLGTGVPPDIVEPPYQSDTIPIFLDQPANNQRLSSRGWELSLTLPELKPIRTRLDVQAAFVRSEVARGDVVFGPASRVSDFQLDERVPRRPYWVGATRTGQRLVATYRLVHHEPAVGFVVTLTVQHIFRERRQDLAATDTLAFAGYITRTGQLVPVPPERRGDPEYADLRDTRGGLLFEPLAPPGDWMANLQLAKSLPFGGRLSFYAFNALDRQGRFAAGGLSARPFSPTRFGLELTLPLDAALRAAGLWP
jgi:hypothetical protein